MNYFISRKIPILNEDTLLNCKGRQRTCARVAWRFAQADNLQGAGLLMMCMARLTYQQVITMPIYLWPTCMRRTVYKDCM